MTKRNGPPTRRDVALAAGVSETIVSYVLNNNRYVAADKRKRVLDAVEKLHYRPNPIARALKGKGSGQLLFIADNIENEYFGALVREMDAIAYDKGYIVSLMTVRNTPDFVSRILCTQADAVVISSSTLEEQYVQQLADAGMPVVLLMTRDYLQLTGHVSRIYTGIESGIMTGIRHLYERGCRHFVHVDRVSTSGHFSDRRDLRYRGFCNQAEVLGIRPDASTFITGCRSHEEVFAAVQARIRSDIPVDAFICRNDRLAGTTLAAVLACGLRVPEDISVMGFDNSTVSTMVRPQLSTLSLERAEVARAAIDQIEAMLQGEQPDDCHLVAQLILRESTR